MQTLETDIQKAGDRENLKALAKEIANSGRKELKAVLLLCTSDNRQIAGRAAWLFSLALKSDMNLMHDDLYSETLACIRKTPYGTVKRNLIHILQFLSIPERCLGELAGLMLGYLADLSQEKAIRAYSITMLQKCTEHIPELSEEVLFLLERDMHYEPLSVRVRADRYLKFIKKKRL